MKITMRTADFKRIIKVCNPIAKAADPSRPGLKSIHVEVDQGKMTATGCDGFRLHTAIADCMHSITRIDDLGLTVTEWPPILFDLPEGISVPKTSAQNVLIEVSEAGDIALDFFMGSKLSFEHPETPFTLNTKALYPKDEPSFWIDFNPKYLSEACAAFADAGRKGVRIQFHGQNGPAIMRYVDNDGSFAFLLPLRS